MPIDPTVIVLSVYAGVLLVMSRRRRDDTPEGFLLAGRTLSIPALVATLVTTWYGGILGVGEFAWRYGISTWFVFGLPYYIAAIVFGLWLAPRLRRTGGVSIPDLLGRAFGRPAALTGAVAVWAGAVPVAYVLMLATLIRLLTGWSPVRCTILGAAFSCAYVGLSGFRAVVRTDAFQMALMFGGFILILPPLLSRTGGLGGLWSALPPTHRAVDGGMGWQAILVWYLIAFQTVVEPAFYQRVFAARTPRVARLGVLLSVSFWAVFDFLSITAGLGARVLLPDLADPLAAYPELARTLLGPWGTAFFMLALFAIVMSTLDSYLFLAASTFGHDFFPGGKPQREPARIRLGLLISGVVAVAGALLFDSAVTVWHHVGSVLTASLLLPVLATLLPSKSRPSPHTAVTAMIVAAATAAGWILAGTAGAYPLGVEPLFPALTAAAGCWLIEKISSRARRTTAE